MCALDGFEYQGIGVDAWGCLVLVELARGVVGRCHDGDAGPEGFRPVAHYLTVPEALQDLHRAVRDTLGNTDGQERDQKKVALQRC